jgi:hypothetical protein
MLPSNLELLKHILDEVSFVRNNTKGKSKNDVVNDPVYQGPLYGVWK